MFQKLINLWSHSRSTHLYISLLLLFLNKDLFKGMTDKANDAKRVFLEGYLIGLCDISTINYYTFTDSCRGFYYTLI